MTMKLSGLAAAVLALAGILATPALSAADRQTAGVKEVEKQRAEKQQPRVRYGLASYYGKGLQGKKTADGETFDKNDISAAHPTYPLGTRLRVTNLSNGRAINVRVNDRGPVQKHRKQGVIIDLSEQAARELGFKHDGRTRVKTEVLEWGEEPAKTAAK